MRLTLNPSVVTEWQIWKDPRAVTGGNAKCLNLEFTAQELVS